MRNGTVEENAVGLGGQDRLLPGGGLRAETE